MDCKHHRHIGMVSEPMADSLSHMPNGGVLAVSARTSQSGWHLFRRDYVLSRREDGLDSTAPILLAVRRLGIAVHHFLL